MRHQRGEARAQSLDVGSPAPPRKLLEPKFLGPSELPDNTQEEDTTTDGHGNEQTKALSVAAAPTSTQGLELVAPAGLLTGDRSSTLKRKLAGSSTLEPTPKTFGTLRLAASLGSPKRPSLA